MKNNFGNLMLFATKMAGGSPDAMAAIQGSAEYPSIWGTTRFYQMKYGVLVVTEVFGLPASQGPCISPIYAFHIHEGGSCTGNAEDPFADALGHYNPEGCAHPNHAGDLPPLFGNDGYAFGAVMTNRFGVDEIIGRTVIIHSRPDDFTTQPSGNSGAKIACGMIR